MKRRIYLPLVLLGLLVFLCLPVFAQKPADKVRLVLQTELGNVEVEIYPAKAPLTAANFLQYVDGGFYDGGVVHRTVKPDNQPNNQIKIEVIQASINAEKKSFAPIKLERTNQTGLKHVNGAISMARSGPDSATSDFFICIGAQPELDFGGQRNPDGQGFAAFGKVTKGMDVVKKLQQAPAEGQRLKPPIKILSLKRKK
jgi:peptidyl-prolyl cis-trans isomerase A (cyclophilin A)